MPLLMKDEMPGLNCPTEVRALLRANQRIVAPMFAVLSLSVCIARHLYNNALRTLPAGLFDDLRRLEEL